MLKNSVGIIPIFVSHMGCPNDCIFCNQRKINGSTEALKPNEIYDYVAEYLATMKRDQVELAFFGGSFTGIDVSLQEAYLSVAYALKRQGKIHKIRLSTRPDYIDASVVERLKKYSVDLVELGCQSFDDDVLSLSKRGHSRAAIFEAVKRLKENKIPFGIQLMLGLPGDTYECFMDSVEQTRRLRPTCIRLYPALVIKETELNESFHAGKFKPISLQTAVEWCADAYGIFERNEMNVIRMGLQKTDLIDFDGEVVAGPFHPAFGELVQSELFKRAICHSLNQLLSIQKIKRSIQVYVNPKQISMAIGQKQINLIKFQEIVRETDDLCHLTIQPHVEVEYNMIQITCEDMTIKQSILYFEV